MGNMERLVRLHTSMGRFPPMAKQSRPNRRLRAGRASERLTDSSPMPECLDDEDCEDEDEEPPRSQSGKRPIARNPFKKRSGRRRSGKRK